MHLLIAPPALRAIPEQDRIRIHNPASKISTFGNLLVSSIVPPDTSVNLPNSLLIRIKQFHIKPTLLLARNILPLVLHQLGATP